MYVIPDAFLVFGKVEVQALGYCAMDDTAPDVQIILSNLTYNLYPLLLSRMLALNSGQPIKGSDHFHLSLLSTYNRSVLLTNAYYICLSKTFNSNLDQL